MDTSSIFVVGGGTGTGARKDAFMVTTDCSAYFSGNVDVSGDGLFHNDLTVSGDVSIFGGALKLENREAADDVCLEFKEPDPAGGPTRGFIRLARQTTDDVPWFSMGTNTAGTHHHTLKITNSTDTDNHGLVGIGFDRTADFNVMDNSMTLDVSGDVKFRNALDVSGVARFRDNMYIVAGASAFGLNLTDVTSGASGPGSYTPTFPGGLKQNLEIILDPSLATFQQQSGNPGPGDTLLPQATNENIGMIIKLNISSNAVQPEWYVGVRNFNPGTTDPAPTYIYGGIVVVDATTNDTQKYLSTSASGVDSICKRVKLGQNTAKISGGSVIEFKYVGENKIAVSGSLIGDAGIAATGLFYQAGL